MEIYVFNQKITKKNDILYIYCERNGRKREKERKKTIYLNVINMSIYWKFSNQHTIN